MSTEDDVLALNYTFNVEKEIQKSIENHTKNWLKQHWIVRTEAELVRLAEAKERGLVG